MAASPNPTILAAARLCGVDAVFAVTGAQAIAALAYGTESVPRVDVIVGPGSLWVQEAKRQVVARRGDRRVRRAVRSDRDRVRRAPTSRR